MEDIYNEPLGSQGFREGDGQSVEQERSERVREGLMQWEALKLIRLPEFEWWRGRNRFPGRDKAFTHNICMKQ